MTSQRRLLVALCLAGIASPALSAAGRSCCPRKGLAAHPAAAVAPLVPFQPGSLVKLLYSPVQTSPAAACPFMLEARRWAEWRRRNPNAPSRFPHAPRASAVAAFAALAPPLAFGAAEPEPDPSVLGCGCDPWNGCGVLHATFGGMY